MMRVWLVVSVVFGLWSGVVGAAEPTTPPSCAILSGTGKRAPDPAVRAVLEARLFAEPGLRFVEREEVARVVQEHNLASAEWSASASRVQLGAIIPADVLLFLQGISVGPNTQTRIDVTESRSGVILRSWIEENASIRSAPDAIVSRIRTAAEKSRIPPEARHLIGLLDFRGEESGLQMESAATTLSDLTIPALSRIPNVLVLDREHIEHLQTERDLTAMEAKLRPSVMLLEGGLRGGGTTNEYEITVQLRRLGGGGATNRVVEAPRADLAAARDRVVEAVAAMLGTLPSGTTDVTRADEAAAFARQITLWEQWGDHARAIRAAEAALAISSSQANRLRLARMLFQGVAVPHLPGMLFQEGEAPMEHILRAKHLELDYYRVQVVATAADTREELRLPVLQLKTQVLQAKAASGIQPGLVQEILRLDEVAFRMRLKHYAGHYDDCESVYWETWSYRLMQYPSLLEEAIHAFDNPPARPQRFTVNRLQVISGYRTALTPELAGRMIRHPHPIIRLFGHAFQERNLRAPATLMQALESRHAIFTILTDEVPATHPYRQHAKDENLWLAMDEWLSGFLPVDPLSKWSVAVPKNAVERDIQDKIRYLDNLLATREAPRLFAMGDHQWFAANVPGGEFAPQGPDPLFDMLQDIADAGQPAASYRLAAEAEKLTRAHVFPSSWQGFRPESPSSWLARWAERFRAEAEGFAKMMEVSGARTEPPNDILAETARASTNGKAARAVVTTRTGGRRGPVVPSDPQSVWEDYEYHRVPLGASLAGDPIAFVDGNRVCVVRRCGYSGHQPSAGVHVYVFWAGSGSLLAERHAAAPVRPVAADIPRPEVCSVVLVGDTAYVGLSSGLLCVPLKAGESKLLTAGDGLPGNVVKAVGWYGGLVYLALPGEGGVLASWDPVSNRFAVVASEKVWRPAWKFLISPV